MQAIDLAIFRWINRWPDALEPLFITLSEGNKWWPVRIILLALLAFFVSQPKLRRPGLLAVLAVPLANEACDLLKNTFQMLRPSVEVPDVIIRVARLDSYGTASAHSANMMAVAAMFFAFQQPRWGAAWLVVAVLTGISRIYIGVHYPYQVLYGWIVGAAVALLLAAIYKAIEARRKSKSGPEETPGPDTSTENQTAKAE